MFRIPGLSKNYFLGIDFGTSSIKVVELEYKNGSSFLSNYGWIEIPQKKKTSDFEIKDDSQDDIEKMQLLKKLTTEMGVKSKNAFIAMGSFKGLSTMITVTDIHEDNLEDVIRVEASKYIPVSLEEVYLSSDIVSKRIEKSEKSSSVGRKFLEKGERETVEVLLVAAPKDDVHKYERIVEGGGFKVASLELDIFSTSRSLVGDSLDKFLLIDIGAKVTNIILVDKGIIRVNRNINVGGDEITKNIASNLNVSWDRAEEFKKKNDYLKEEGRAIVLPILSLIAKESKRLAELVSVGNNLSKPLNKIILVGGGSDVAGITDIFKDVLNVEVALGNPFEKIIIEDDAIKANINKLASKFSVAVGLAIKGVENYKKKYKV